MTGTVWFGPATAARAARGLAPVHDPHIIDYFSSGFISGKVVNLFSKIIQALKTALQSVMLSSLSFNLGIKFEVSPDLEVVDIQQDQR